MDIKEELKLREGLINDASRYISDAIAHVDSSIYNVGYISPEAEEKAKSLLEKARSLGWAVILKKAIGGKELNTMLLGIDSSSWANKSFAYIKEYSLKTAEDIRQSLQEQRAKEGLPPSTIETNTVIKNVLNQKRRYRIYSYATDAIEGSFEKAKFEIINTNYSSDSVLKTWRTMDDDRVRLTHSMAEGQTIEINNYFLVGNASLMYPRDINAPINETINCRCAVEYSRSWSN
jgi:hypothetical protein